MREVLKKDKALPYQYEPVIKPVNTWPVSGCSAAAGLRVIMTMTKRQKRQGEKDPAPIRKVSSIQPSRGVRRFSRKRLKHI